MTKNDRYGMHRNFSYLASGNNYEELTGITLRSEIDGLTGERIIVVYTDDGNGNGEAVIEMRDPGIINPI